MNTEFRTEISNWFLCNFPGIVRWGRGPIGLMWEKSGEFIFGG